MPYIGRGTDKLSNVEVLDNITFDGSSSYTLQKGGSNFTPSSANTLLVSIDGVVQAGNFTVSGSTIDFGTAVAGTSTCDFILHYGIGLITTPADGTVTNDKINYPLTKSGAIVSTFNRTTSDGDILELQKDGVTLGSIGNNGNNLIIEGKYNTSKSGLEFPGNIIISRQNSAPADNAIDLGDATRRFANLYLGGGLYVGGTGTANYLDDYEQGTFTPILATGTASAEGSYIKIGNLVNVNIYITSISDTSTNSALRIDNLPFQAQASASSVDSTVGSVMLRYLNTAGTSQSLCSYVSHTTNRMQFYEMRDANTYNNLTHDQFNSNNIGLRASVTYRTT